MMSERMKDVPLLSEDDVRAIFNSMWKDQPHLYIRATKKNPDRLISIRHFLTAVDRAIQWHVTRAARESVGNRK